MGPAEGEPSAVCSGARGCPYDPAALNVLRLTFTLASALLPPRFLLSNPKPPILFIALSWQHTYCTTELP